MSRALRRLTRSSRFPSHPFFPSRLPRNPSPGRERRPFRDYDGIRSPNLSPNLSPSPVLQPGAYLMPGSSFYYHARAVGRAGGPANRSEERVRQTDAARRTSSIFCSFTSFGCCARAAVDESSVGGVGSWSDAGRGYTTASHTRSGEKETMKSKSFQ